jgi:predicted Zn-dependent protease
MTAAAALALASLPARAQTGSSAGIPMIRDAEIEQLLREYSQPILRVAGLSQQNVQIVIINDKSFNAFVMDGHRIFVNSGALMQATTPNELIGVFAHETGHIVGGHLSKMRQELANATTAAIVAMLVGAGAMVAAAKSSNYGNSLDLGNAGAAIFSAPQSYLAHTILAYQRAQEDQADRSGVRFLTMTGQSAKGMYDTFKRFADEMMFTAAYIDPYVQNHPMPAERMAALAELVKTPYWDKKDPPELQFRHDMMRAKLYGFTERAETVLRRYPTSNTSIPARYARAIVTYRFGDMRSALTQIQSLIQAMPNNPYFYELEGQALLENGHAAEAIPPLRRAVELAPNPALLQILLGQALIATKDPKLASEAVPLLKAALSKEPESGDAYEQLAMAYGHNGKLAEADLASAQAAFARGDNKTARELAARAKTRFPIGSPGWVRADDIVAFNKGKSPLLFGQ